MIIKRHLCGVAIAYEPLTRKVKDPERSPSTYRVQGSLYGQQKRAIADAAEYLRIAGQHKPLIFVATSPGFTERADEAGLIKKLTHNLRNSYDCKDYIWVREYTGAGYPHFHFICDMPKFNVQRLTMYWSGLFGSDAKNSIRLGTAPDKNGRRKYYISSQKMCWYLTKYIGKSLSDEEKARGKKVRSFAISENARQNSQPVIFSPRIHSDFTNKIYRDYEAEIEDPDGIPHTYRVDPYSYKWRKCGDHEVYIGVQKKFRKLQ